MTALPALLAEIDATDALTEHLRDVADRMLANAIERGAALYVRERCLAPLIGDWRGMSDEEIVTRLKIKLHAMERLMLATGHHAGDLNRVITLKQALAAEENAIEQAHRIRA